MSGTAVQLLIYLICNDGPFWNCMNTPPPHTHMYTVQLLFAFCYIDRKKNEIL